LATGFAADFAAGLAAGFATLFATGFFTGFGATFLLGFVVAFALAEDFLAAGFAADFALLAGFLAVARAGLARPLADALDTGLRVMKTGLPKQNPGQRDPVENAEHHPRQTAGQDQRWK
jgi:asparagine N-glycosylation enzyme membrane subunit Stt3